jgi:MFS family permease
VAEALRILFFPALLAGALCCIVWSRLANRDERLSFFLIGVGLFTLPQFAVVLLGTAATELVLYRQVVLAIWLTAFGAFAAWRAVRILEGRPLPTARSQRINSPIFLGIIALAFGGFGLYTAKVSAEDLFLPHAIFEGPVTRKWVQHGSRSAPEFYIMIGDRPVQVGQDLYRRLRPGEVVRAEVTAGSRTVVRVYRGTTSRVR